MKLLLQQKRWSMTGNACLPGDEYISLIQFLLDAGVNPNALCSNDDNEPGIPRNETGTIFDLFSYFLMLPHLWFSDHMEFQGQKLKEMLQSHGCILTKPLSSIQMESSRTWHEGFQIEISVLRHFPEQIERKSNIWSNGMTALTKCSVWLWTFSLGDTPKIREGFLANTGKS